MTQKKQVLCDLQVLFSDIQLSNSRATADCFLYLGYLFFIWIDPYFYCPIYLSHPDSLYTDGLFQQVLYFKISFALSDILSSSIFLLYFITMISQKHWMKIKEHIVLLFYYNIFIVSEQVFLWFFMNLSRHARMCNSSPHL